MDYCKVWVAENEYEDYIKANPGFEKNIISDIKGKELWGDISVSEKEFGTYSIRLYQYDHFLKQIEFSYKYKDAMVQNAVILTPGKIEYSYIADKLELGTGKNEGYYVYPYLGNDYKVTTCIRFKGLEADAIVLIGLDKSSFTGSIGMEFLRRNIQSKTVSRFYSVD